jgi:hypothetical protein
MRNRDDLHSGRCFVEHKKIREPPERRAARSEMENRESIGSRSIRRIISVRSWTNRSAARSLRR